MNETAVATAAAVLDGLAPGGAGSVGDGVVGATLGGAAGGSEGLGSRVPQPARATLAASTTVTIALTGRMVIIPLFGFQRLWNPPLQLSQK
jgi:hypothetical protein